jgi:hypothetical protein
MKNSRRWAWFLAAAAVLSLGLYYFIVPSHAVYAMMGLGDRHFEASTFPWGFIIGLLSIIGLFVLYKLLFPSSGSQSTKEEDLCPYCGRELERSESVSGVRPGDPAKEKA